MSSQVERNFWRSEVPPPHMREVAAFRGFLLCSHWTHSSTIVGKPGQKQQWQFWLWIDRHKQGEAGLHSGTRWCLMMSDAINTELYDMVQSAQTKEYKIQKRKTVNISVTRQLSTLDFGLKNGPWELLYTCVLQHHCGSTCPWAPDKHQCEDHLKLVNQTWLVPLH